MHLLHSKKGCLHVHDDASPLEMWVKKHGAASLLKYNELCSAGNASNAIKFYADSLEHMLEAVIDPENELSDSDKLSQVSESFTAPFFTPVYFQNWGLDKDSTAAELLSEVCSDFRSNNPSDDLL